MTRISIIGVLLLFLYSGSFAQVTESISPLVDANNNFFAPNYLVRPKTSGLSIDGNPLLFKKNVKGQIVAKNSPRTKMIQTNFNLLTNETIITTLDKTHSVNSNYLDSMIVYDGNYNRKFIYSKPEGEKEIRLLEVLVEGPNPLYKLVKTKLLKPNYNHVLQTGTESYRLDFKKYYYVSQIGKLVRLPRSKRKLKQEKTLNKKLVKQLRDQKVNLRSEDELIEFFQDQS